MVVLDELSSFKDADVSLGATFPLLRPLRLFECSSLPLVVLGMLSTTSSTFGAHGGRSERELIYRARPELIDVFFGYSWGFIKRSTPRLD